MSGQSTMATKPIHEQAQLHLQVYEERREVRLRRARDWFFKNYFADTLDEAMRIAAPRTENGTSFMMVVGYWDQTCALLNASVDATNAAANKSGGVLTAQHRPSHSSPFRA
jgi:urocanate hydratase